LSSEGKLKLSGTSPKFTLGEVVLYTPETSTGNANGMREYLAFVGQVEDVDGGVEYHLVVFAPFQRPQWYGNVKPFRKGEARRGSFRGLSNVPE
jgi:hypothetical protein